MHFGRDIYRYRLYGSRYHITLKARHNSHEFSCTYQGISTTTNWLEKKA